MRRPHVIVIALLLTTSCSKSDSPQSESSKPSGKESKDKKKSNDEDDQKGGGTAPTMAPTVAPSSPGQKKKDEEDTDFMSIGDCKDFQKTCEACVKKLEAAGDKVHAKTQRENCDGWYATVKGSAKTDIAKQTCAGYNKTLSANPVCK